MFLQSEFTMQILRPHSESGFLEAQPEICTFIKLPRQLPSTHTFQSYCFKDKIISYEESYPLKDIQDFLKLFYKQIHFFYMIVTQKFLIFISNCPGSSSTLLPSGNSHLCCKSRDDETNLLSTEMGILHQVKTLCRAMGCRNLDPYYCLRRSVSRLPELGAAVCCCLCSSQLCRI